MKTATILLAAALLGGTGVGVMAPITLAKTSSTNKSQDPGLIKKGMTLAEAEQATNGNATRVGGLNNGVQAYRFSYRQSTGDGGVNDHPIITIYLFGVKNDKVTWVRRSK